MGTSGVSHLQHPLGDTSKFTTESHKLLQGDPSVIGVQLLYRAI